MELKLIKNQSLFTLLCIVDIVNTLGRVKSSNCETGKKKLYRCLGMETYVKILVYDR